MEALMTVEEVAQYLRVPLSWVYERTRTQTIPFHRIGKRFIRIDKDELLAWIHQSDEE